MHLELVAVIDKQTGRMKYYAVNDKHYDAMLASGGSSLDDQFEWKWIGSVEISEEILNEEGYFYLEKISTKEIYFNRLFNLICDMVWAEGGDGCAIILSDKYKEIADKFDKWLERNKRANQYERYDGSDYVLFTDNSNENVVFSRENKDESCRMFEIVINLVKFCPHVL